MFGKEFKKAAAWAVMISAAGAVGGVAHADPVGTMKAAPEWVDGDFKFKVRGRVHYDISTAESEGGYVADYFNTGIRRAHFGVEGQFNKRWKYRAEWVLNPSSTTEVGVDDFYVEWVGNKYSLLLGNHNVANPLEERTSSNTIQLVERSAIINALGYGRLAGLGFITSGANWSASTGLYGDSLDADDSSTTVAEEAVTSQSRVTFAPIMSKSPEGTTLLHLGANYRYRTDGSSSLGAYASKPSQSRGLAATSGLEGLAHQNDSTWGLEAAGWFNRFGFQAEYLSSKAELTSGADFDTSGYYVDAFFSLTGEDRNYSGSTGSFGRVTPRSAVGEGGMGSWMLSGRYEKVEIEDVGTTGGEQTGWVAGVQWNPIAYVTFKLNYAHTDTDRFGAGVDSETDVIALRSQFDW